MGVTKYLRPGWARRDEAVLERVTIIDPPDPLEGTRMSLWNSILPNWYAEQDGSSLMGGPDLVSRVWVANRCQHLNSSQISAMPLKWHGSGSRPTPARRGRARP